MKGCCCVSSLKQTHRFGFLKSLNCQKITTLIPAARNMSNPVVSFSNCSNVVVVVFKETNT